MELIVWPLSAAAVLLQMLAARQHLAAYRSKPIDMDASRRAYVANAASALAMLAASAILAAVGLSGHALKHVEVFLIAGLGTFVLAVGVNAAVRRRAIRRSRIRHREYPGFQSIR